MQIFVVVFVVVFIIVVVVVVVKKVPQWWPRSEKALFRHLKG